MIPTELRTLNGPEWPRWDWVKSSAKSDQAGYDVGLTAVSELRWFQGHFEGHPLLPGVVQTHIAGTVARVLLRPEGAFSGIGNLKFQQIVLPDQSMVLSLRRVVDKSAVDFTLCEDDVVFSRGRLRFEGSR